MIVYNNAPIQRDDGYGERVDIQRALISFCEAPRARWRIWQRELELGRDVEEKKKV